MQGRCARRDNGSAGPRAMRLACQAFGTARWHLWQQFTRNLRHSLDSVGPWHQGTIFAVDSAMEKSMLRVALGASCSLGSLAALGMLLAACGGTIVGPPDSSSGNAGTSPGGQAASGSAGASPTNGGAGGAMGGAPSKTLSPEACLRAGGQPVSSKGGRLSPETDCESGVALAIIDSASSGWDEGGLCCAIGKDPMQRACGARAGDTCSATEFCAYEPPQLCGRADAQSFCAPRPEECIELYAPVCGCDQRTYENSCFANAAGTGIYTAGECVEQR